MEELCLFLTGAAIVLRISIACSSRSSSSTTARTSSEAEVNTKFRRVQDRLDEQSTLMKRLADGETFARSEEPWVPPPQPAPHPLLRFPLPRRLRPPLR